MSNRLRVLRLVIAALAISLVATPVLAGPARDKKADKALRGALKGRTEQHTVILRVKPGTRRQIRQAIEQCGGVVKKEHQLIDALTVNLQGNCLDAILENQNVKSAGSDASVTSTPVIGFSDDSGVNADPVQVYGAYSVREAVGGHEWATGSGIGVAVIDSGIAPLPAFEDRITAFYDFTGGGVVATAPNDGYGHGTHVAGLIGGNDALFPGVAVDVNLIGLKVLNASGSGLTSDVIRALEFAVANRDAAQHPDRQPLARSPDSRAGRRRPARAGGGERRSRGPDRDGLGRQLGQEPGHGRAWLRGHRLAGQCAVGDHDGRVGHEEHAHAHRRQRGAVQLARAVVVRRLREAGHPRAGTQDGVADGFRQLPLLALRAEPRLEANGTHYLSLSGTSMASAMTAGVIATVLESHQWYSWYAPQPLTPTAVKALLQYSAVPLTSNGAPIDALSQATGQINAEGATRVAGTIAWLASAGSDPAMGAFDPANVSR